VISIFGQDAEADSLKKLLASAPKDTNRIGLLLEYASTYYFSKPDTCLELAKQALNLARELQFPRGEAAALNFCGESLRFLGDYPGALKMQFEALRINRKMKNPMKEARTLAFIGFVYIELREYRQALEYLFEANKINFQMPDSTTMAFNLSNIGNAYYLLQMHDSALYYQQIANEKSTGVEIPPLHTLILTRLGDIYASLGKRDTALKFYHSALLNATVSNDKVNISKIQKNIAEIYESSGQQDSALFYAHKSLVNGQSASQKLEILETSNLLAKIYRQTKNYDSAFLYEDIAGAMKDSLFGPQKFKQLQLLMLDEQDRQQKIEQEQEAYRNKIKYISLLTALGIFLVLAFILMRNNRQKQQANNLLNEQKNKIENTLTELKAMQAQLIQSEKMASLGELTAGIAHEIQNPLNFVNNFSEVSNELLEEMKTDLNNGNKESAFVIAGEVQTNLEKILHHGKRADEIVKGMLQHSRTGSGIKEPTDINVLVDEYLRLSYHGWRAKDKSFNVTIVTDLADQLENINIISQDIGRVLLNLFNNAFYAVTERKKQLEKNEIVASTYQPKVTVRTRKLPPRPNDPTGRDSIEIIVEDNGGGIPKNVKDKIFQPFFTTKPAGKGTGLGLSLSYDIVKAHEGEIKLATDENNGTQFFILLPIM
jgi:signal transduction histidine kinase